MGGGGRGRQHQMGSVDLVQKHLSGWRKLENRTICYIIRSSRQLHFVPPAAVKWEIMKLWNNAPLSLPSCFKVNLGQRGKGVWDGIPTSSYARFFLVFIFLSAHPRDVDAGVTWDPDVRLQRGRSMCVLHTIPAACSDLWSPASHSGLWCMLGSSLNRRAKRHYSQDWNRHKDQ